MKNSKKILKSEHKYQITGIWRQCRLNIAKFLACAMYDTFFNEEQKILTNHSQKDGKKDPFLYPAPFKFFLKKYIPI